jgi:ankyrin repeat protein
MVLEGGRYNTALQAASSGGHLEIAKSLLDHGADPNIPGERNFDSHAYYVIK